jgi:type I restriction enzyme S subunit
MGMSTDTTPPPPTVPPGYKQTEVGVIPVEWEVKKIGEVASIKTGSRNTQDQNPDGLYPFFVRSQEVERIDTYSFDGEAVLTAGDGVGTGKVFHYIAGRFDLHQRVYQISDFALSLDGRYFFFQFSTRFYDRIMSMTAKSSVDSVRMEMIAGMSIPLAPLPEQRAIAAALSDVDGLITALDRLIAKKRAIKQATMQQLLTGKTRLPGFGGAWEKRHVIEFGEVVTGGTPNTNIDIYWGEEYPWITPTDISTHRDMFTSERRLSWKGLNAIRYLPANSVLVTCIASIGKNAILKLQGGCNQQINAVIPNEHYSHEFLYYLFESSKKYLLAKAGITATSIVSKAAFEELNFLVPPLPEQRAIAAVLSDMDAEIAALEQRRAKTQAIKQGMMQQLLTGRIRLTTEEVNV